MLSMEDELKILEGYKKFVGENDFKYHPPHAFMCYLKTICDIEYKGKGEE